MNELAMIRGDSLILPCGVKVNHPTVGQICDFGEERYFQSLSTLIAVPQDFRVLLHDAGVNCDDITEFELFMMLYQTLPPDDTRIFFGDLDLREFEVFVNNKNKQLVLYHRKRNILIDSFVHHEIISFLRQINKIEKKMLKAGNAATAMRLIELDRQNMMLEKQKGKATFSSILVPQLSALVNSAGFKYDYKTCMDLPLYAFFDAVNRIQKIKHIDALMHGISAGTVDASKVSKTELNWMG